MIRVNNLVKYLGEEKILDDINLSVKEGSIYGLIGPNGAGKSTLIRNMVGIYTPDEGEVLLNGMNVQKEVQIRAKLGYVPDFQNFYPSFRVEERIDFYKNTYTSWNKQRFDNLSKLFKINPKRKIRQLSKGQKTQLSIHLNLSIMPKVMIIDEPTSGLDPVIRKEVLNLIVDEVSMNNTTILVSTHNLNELERICDSIGMINKGKMLMETHLDELKENVQKIQVVFKDEIPNEIQNNSDILKIEKSGKVYSIVVQKDIEKLIEVIKKYNPLLVETIDMSLEEIFIYKMGGEGYEFKDIIQ